VSFSSPAAAAASAKALVDDLLTRGAKRVYATARAPKPSTDDRVVPLALEVTDLASIDALAAAAPDVTVLINNAGVNAPGTYLDAPLDGIWEVFEANFFGPAEYDPRLHPDHRAQRRRPHPEHALGAVLGRGHGSYAATKAALWSQTNGIRLELLKRGIGVTGLHVGYVDTDLTAGIGGPKSTPEDVAKPALDGIESGAFEVLADDVSRRVKAGLSADLTALYPQLTT
jgi:NAD(P)-dependent dehydrogenase (short-subunit alcohol dehydrogenase family)